MPTFPQLEKPQGAEIGGLTLALGLFTVKVDAVALRRPNSKNEAGGKMICGHPHDAPTPVKEYYICADDHRNTRGTCGKARLLDGVLVPLDPGAKIEAVTGGLRANELALTPHPAGEVEAWTRPEGAGYRLRLQKDAATSESSAYATLLDLASDPDTVLCGPMVVGSTRRFWVLREWQGQLYIEARIETADLAPPDVQALPEPIEKLVATARMVRDAMLEPFDPALHRHDAKAAVDKLAAAVLANPGAVVTAAAVDETTSVEGLLAGLEDMLAKQRTKKNAAARKAAGKKAPAKAKAG